MHQKQTIHVLLAALILLMNLGEELHRLPVFGFHLSHCCSCSEHASPSVDDFETTVDTGRYDRAHDCQFCKFYEHFDAPLPKTSALTLELDSTQHFSLFAQSGVLGQRFYWSRGPPVPLS